MSKLSFLKRRKLKDSITSLKSEEQRRWSSETDLEKLPPLSPALPISPRLASKGMHHIKQRPPTPSPNRSLNENISRLIPLSPSNSSQRLSLNLDLLTLKEEILSEEGKLRDRVNSSGSITDSPRLRVRSLPSSPRSPRHRFRRPNSESDSLKDDRIVEWIQTVQKCDNTSENDDVLDHGMMSDVNEFDGLFGGSPVLPPIQEHTRTNSGTNLHLT